jgi:hypothetical protein
MLRSQVLKCSFLGALCSAVLLASCVDPIPKGGTDRVWTIRELEAMKGKTRDEVRAEMGKATGVYTIDAKGRWHYPSVLIRYEGEREPRTMIVMVYFSKFGEQRCTLVEVRERMD